MVEYISIYFSYEQIMTDTVKAFDRSVNIAPKTSFLSLANCIFSTMERSAFWVLKPLRNPH